MVQSASGAPFPLRGRAGTKGLLQKGVPKPWAHKEMSTNPKKKLHSVARDGSLRLWE